MIRIKDSYWCLNIFMSKFNKIDIRKCCYDLTYPIHKLNNKLIVFYNIEIIYESAHVKKVIKCMEFLYI